MTAAYVWHTYWYPALQHVRQRTCVLVHGREIDTNVHQLGIKISLLPMCLVQLRQARVPHFQSRGADFPAHTHLRRLMTRFTGALAGESASCAAFCPSSYQKLRTLRWTICLPCHMTLHGRALNWGNAASLMHSLQMPGRGAINHPRRGPASLATSSHFPDSAVGALEQQGYFQDVH